MEAAHRVEHEPREDGRLERLIYLREAFEDIRVIEGGSDYNAVYDYFVTVAIAGEQEFGHRAVEVLDAFPENKVAFHAILDDVDAYLESRSTKTLPLTNEERSRIPISRARALQNLVRTSMPGGRDDGPFELYVRDRISWDKYAGMDADAVIATLDS